MSLDMPKVVISLVTYNGAQHLPYCLESIQKQTFSDFELVVLDNASSDSTREIISVAFPQCVVIAENVNLGFALGHNRVIDRTSSDYVLILNQDVAMNADYLERCVSYLEEHKDVASVNGLLIQTKALSERMSRDVIDSAGIAFRWNYFFEERLRNYPQDVLQEPHEIFGASGTVGLFRRKALDEIALTINGKKEYFDTDFFMYKEDVDLAFRLRWLGWLSFVVPQAQAYHVRSGKKEAQRANALINYVSYRNNIAVFLKNMSLSLFFTLLPAFILFETAKLLYCVLYERSTLSAWRDIRILWPIYLHKRTMIMSNRKISSCAMMRALHI